MAVDCSLYCDKQECPVSSKKEKHYQHLLISFLRSNALFGLIPENLRLGAFLYNTHIARIVYADENFLNNNQISDRNIEHPAIGRFLLSKIHPVDVRRISLMKRIADKKGHANFLNGIVRIKFKDGYRAIHFMIVKPDEKYSDCEHFRIGIQLKPSSSQTNTHDEIDELEHYQQLIDTLSEREQSILKCIVQGQTDKEVGEILHISAHTAQKHRKNILKKLGIKNTAALSFIAGKSQLF
ncbi:LuxR C-terminal-related transcriptional regulator [Carboxylicivirga marina]|uniref:LuxR family transcriptional regulator n=1 Tax=Carboxylicivirga marina TaxID=2800988 RepID=A0ABS1HH82_9BACT|nr:LuxR C-terminal-related transcriptional regulator [Carboxylicivirga marina]MBK3516946.1 LuxR family transcriptional regulator [Carboxylicivirga marina]